MKIKSLLLLFIDLDRSLGFLCFDNLIKIPKSKKQKIANKINAIKIPLVDNGESIKQLEKIALYACVTESQSLILESPSVIKFSN